MNQVFEHITQTRYLLYQLFESGLISRRGMETELNDCARTADELGLTHGAKLILTLIQELAALRAGQGTLGSTVLSYTNLITYYDMAASRLTIENMAHPS